MLRDIWGIDRIKPRRIAGKCTCHSYRSDRNTVFPSASALWRERVFEPFLSWVNLELAKATWLEFHGNVEWATWVKLNEG